MSWYWVDSYNFYKVNITTAFGQIKVIFVAVVVALCKFQVSARKSFTWNEPKNKKILRKLKTAVLCHSKNEKANYFFFLTFSRFLIKFLKFSPKNSHFKSKRFSSFLSNHKILNHDPTRMTTTKIERSHANICDRYCRYFLLPDQCDHIGRFLIVVGDNFLKENGPSNW